MKKIYFALLALLSLGEVSAQKKWVEDGNVQVREIQGSFSAIKVSGGILLYLSQSDEEKVAVSASDSKMVDGIRTVLEGKTLRIYYDGDKGWGKKNRNMTVYVSFKNLDQIEASGATNVQAEDMIRVPELALRLSGASDFAGSVDTRSLNLNLSGASDIRIAGKASTLQITGSGASDVKGYGLEAEFCEARASGASDIRVTVTKELKANASGASSIRYKGAATLSDVHSSGASSISRADD